MVISMRFNRDKWISPLMKNKVILTYIFILMLFPSLAASSSPLDIGSFSAAEVIAQINNYRAQNGLPAYSINSALMISAQAQSDYQASITTVTHTGPGGSRPRDRAYAAGYGNGSTIWVSEIIYGGYQATVNVAMGWWKTSQIHNDTMLSSNYQEIGAGVSSSGGRTYFTAVMGYVVGGTTADYGSSGSGEPAILTIPVEAAEPREDGSIIHVVRTGQALWNIAAVYDVSIEQILELNGLSQNSVIQPGQEILVRPPDATKQPTETAISTLIAASEPGAEPSATIQPSLTTTSPKKVAAASSDENQQAANMAGQSSQAQASLIDKDIRTALLIGLACFFIATLFIAFTRLDNNPKNDHP